MFHFRMYLIDLLVVRMVRTHSNFGLIFFRPNERQPYSDTTFLVCAEQQPSSVEIWSANRKTKQDCVSESI